MAQTDRKRLYGALLLAIVAGTIACTPKQSPADLKERTAQATADLKQNAKAVAEGVKEGWNRDKPLDINSASREDLKSLPGIAGPEADAIIASRPYRRTSELVTRTVISQAQFDRISDKITAR
ncbi:MAG: helix-hairpin-helix domain-containing protein [Acidobacteria bacterium]|nr:helix-hairpin-helix domain-containing protein [Acidobacteriota bacterium]